MSHACTDRRIDASSSRTHPCGLIVEPVVGATVPQNSDLIKTGIAEILQLAARPTPYHNDERTLLEFHFNVGNYLTFVTVKHVQLLQDAVLNLKELKRLALEPHTVRLVGDTEHGMKFEPGELQE